MGHTLFSTSTLQCLVACWVWCSDISPDFWHFKWRLSGRMFCSQRESWMRGDCHQHLKVAQQFLAKEKTIWWWSVDPNHADWYVFTKFQPSKRDASMKCVHLCWSANEQPTYAEIMAVSNLFLRRNSVPCIMIYLVVCTKPASIDLAVQVNSVLVPTIPAQIHLQELCFAVRTDRQRRRHSQTHRGTPPHIDQPFLLTQWLHPSLLLVSLVALLLLFTGASSAASFTLDQNPFAFTWIFPQITCQLWQQGVSFVFDLPCQKR